MTGCWAWWQDKEMSFTCPLITVCNSNHHDMSKCNMTSWMPSSCHEQQTVCHGPTHLVMIAEHFIWEDICQYVIIWQYMKSKPVFMFLWYERNSHVQMPPEGVVNDWSKTCEEPPPDTIWQEQASPVKLRSVNWYVMLGITEEHCGSTCGCCLSRAGVY